MIRQVPAGLVAALIFGLYSRREPGTGPGWLIAAAVCVAVALIAAIDLWVIRLRIRQRRSRKRAGLR